MITSRAKKIGVVAISYCLGAGLVLAGTIYFTEQNKTKFAEVRNRNAEAQATKQLVATTEQTLLLSEKDRQTLDTFFIAERDTIHFIAQVEALAETLGVGVETTQLAVKPGKDEVPSRLEIGFIVKGTYGAVAQMLSALETLPYHKTIPNTSIKKSDTGQWVGTVVMYVTLL
jgi:hypothetical protein